VSTRRSAEFSDNSVTSMVNFLTRKLFTHELYSEVGVDRYLSDVIHIRNTVFLILL
jgi:hypothetical protein